MKNDKKQPENDDIPKEKLEYVKKQESITKFYQVIGKNIYSARKSLKFTQEQLADKLGISRVSVNNIETGKQRLPVHLLHLVANQLNITVSDILNSIPTIEKEALLSNETKVVESFDKNFSKDEWDNKLIESCKYGYEYRANTQFPEMSFEDNCLNNFRQKIQTSQFKNTDAVKVIKDRIPELLKTKSYSLINELNYILKLIQP